MPEMLSQYGFSSRLTILAFYLYLSFVAFNVPMAFDSNVLYRSLYHHEPSNQTDK